jgi:16S rRNA (guanine527-N7)-methyltransferase
VTARGCAPLDRLLALAERFIGPQTTCLFLKGARAGEELTATGKAWTMTVSRHPSRADPGGIVLSLQQVVREPRRA